MKLTQNSNVLIAASCEHFTCSTFFSGSHALFIRPASILFIKITLKLGPTVLFTHLKIILLQCFQFSTINGIQMDPD